MAKMTLIRVRDVMKTNFGILDGKATIREALLILQKTEARAVVVDKRHTDDEYGLVLLSDIAKNVLAHDRAPERVNVYEIMTKPTLMVPSRMDIRYCARLFERFGVPRAPVVDDDKVVGIVSYHDMVLKGLVNWL
ncbi:MAG TPA: CBS domain-containing protein [Gammaproteobacteria bacterium]|nr:CBS domain-containing protein [Gammaproteobacteria bacterium]